MCAGIWKNISSVQAPPPSQSGMTCRGTLTERLTSGDQTPSAEAVSSATRMRPEGRVPRI